MDGGNNPTSPGTLAGIDLYAPTVEALRLRYPGLGVEQAMDRARREGPAMVVATDGASGTWYQSADGSGHVPAAPVTLGSTLGAGDVFHEAWLADVVEGRRSESQ